VIIGGPPCQPFSVRGLQNGKTDARNGFPAFLSLVENYEPKIAIFENVRGMFYRNKSYFEGVMASLESLHYIVDMKILNAVNFGVPQKRERLFVVAHRGEWKFPSPDPTSRLYTAGDAIGDIVDIGNGDLNRYVTPNMDAYISVYEKKSHCIRPRDLRFDEPSRTLTCRNLCGATSDMMRVRLSDGRRRRLTPREATRLQSFPDWFEFVGTESSQYNQIGNSVPPLLAKAVAKSTLDCLNGLSIDKSEIKKFKPNKQSAFALATSET
jgi:DNA (cytosine-5)-methyltransferase 1